jgi:hypothetical protein
MWKTRCLITLWASTACYRGSLALTFVDSQMIDYITEMRIEWNYCFHCLDTETYPSVCLVENDVNDVIFLLNLLPEVVLPVISEHVEGSS